MTTAMFTANFDLQDPEGENKVALNMCEARGCGDRTVVLLRSAGMCFNLPKQGWMDHMQQARYAGSQYATGTQFQEGQVLRNGQYSNAFGEEKSFEWSIVGAWSSAGLVRNIPACRDSGYGQLRGRVSSYLQNRVLNRREKRVHRELRRGRYAQLA